MTVGELKKQLAELDDDMRVMVRGQIVGGLSNPRVALLSVNENQRTTNTENSVDKYIEIENAGCFTALVIA